MKLTLILMSMILSIQAFSASLKVIVEGKTQMVYGGTKLDLDVFSRDEVDKQSVCYYGNVEKAQDLFKVLAFNSGVIDKKGKIIKNKDENGWELDTRYFVGVEQSVIRVILYQEFADELPINVDYRVEKCNEAAPVRVRDHDLELKKYVLKMFSRVQSAGDKLAQTKMTYKKDSLRCLGHPAPSGDWKSVGVCLVNAEDKASGGEHLGITFAVLIHEDIEHPDSRVWNVVVQQLTDF